MLKYIPAVVLLLAGSLAAQVAPPQRWRVNADGSISPRGDRSVKIGTPLPAANPPAGSLNVAGNIYKDGVEFTNGVPYSGATQDVDLGLHGLIANDITASTADFAVQATPTTPNPGIVRPFAATGKTLQAVDEDGRVTTMVAPGSCPTGIGSVNADGTISCAAAASGSPTQISEWDDFLSGGTTSGTIGKLGWAVRGTGGGTLTASSDLAMNSDSAHPGVIKITTSATNGHGGVMEPHLYSGLVMPSPATVAGWSAEFIVRTDSAVTARDYHVGLLASSGSQSLYAWASSATALTCAGGVASPVTGNWILTTQIVAGSARWCYDTGVALAADTWVKAAMRSTSIGNVEMGFATGTDALVYQTVPSQIPSGDTFRPGVGVKTLTAGAAGIFVDYISFTRTGIVR